MNLERIYTIGNMLGLEYKDLQNLIPEKTSSDLTSKIDLPYSPLDAYKMEGGFYGTISINDF
jgi:hypothetical protein